MGVPIRCSMAEADRSSVATLASTNLNRILKLTANMLFEKQEDPKDVAKLLQGFVTNAMVRSWYEDYCKTNGISQDTNLKTHRRRLPMPPINWQAVELKTLDEMLAPVPEEPPEPNW